MLSRRNIRVKVMQTLYALDSLSEGLKPGEPGRILSKKIDQSRKLFTYLVYFVSEVARYAEKDAAKKAGKHLPTAEDLSVNTRIAGNELVWKIIENPSFESAVADLGLVDMADRELLRKIYSDLVATPEY
ncbi:MAG: transcription antitermination factor NusB, partial [Chitinophagaceae bacterium]